jgi:Xaa-Pro aminopeptidase
MSPPADANFDRIRRRQIGAFGAEPQADFLLLRTTGERNLATEAPPRIIMKKPRTPAHSREAAMNVAAMNVYVPSGAVATTLSLRERDRRYAAVRAELRRRGLQAVVVTGSNLQYLSDGVPRELFGVLSVDENEPFTDILIWRALADVSIDVVREAQDWVSDIRSGRDGVAVAARLKELRLDKAKVGYAGALSQRVFSQIVKELPNMSLVEASDAFVNLRTIKSDEEIALIDRANVIFDKAVEQIHAKARPGMLGRELIQLGRVAIWEAGGDLDSYFSFSFGAVGSQNPILAEYALERRIEAGDIGTLTSHTIFHQYCGHSDQELAFGKPRPLHVEMFAGVVHVRDKVLKIVKPGATHRDLVDLYEEATAETGFKTSTHSQMHLYGIDVPEFPGPAFKIDDPKGGEGLGGSGNFVLEAGMIFSISPTLINEKTGDSVLGGTSLVVTNDGYLNFGDRPVELLVSA